MRRLVSSFLVLLAPYVGALATQVETSCQIHGQELYSYVGSLDRQIAFRYDQRGEALSNHQLGILVNNCQKASGKFLMVGFGPNEYSLDSSSYSTVFSQDLDSLQCQIIDNPLASQSEEERNRYFKNRRQFLEQCVEITVAHNSSRPLTYRADQLGCTVTAVSPQRATFVGGNCFFKIYDDSEFVVAHQIKKECLNKDFLSTHAINPQEVSAATTFAVADKPTGLSTEMELLPSRLTHFILEPSSKLIALSDDYGRNIPRYLDNFYLPKIEFGALKIRNMRDGGLIKIPLLVDNRCQDTCQSGLCSSPCRFTQPVVGEVSLYQIEKGKKVYLKSWYDGAAALPNWQGFLNMPGQFIKGVSFEQNKRYAIELVLRDPKSDYTMYNKSTTPLFMPLPGIPTMDFAANLLNGIPSIASEHPIQEIEAHHLIPDFGVIRDFGKFSGAQGVDAIQTLSKHSYWPPFYSKICSGNSCVKPESRAYYRLELQFTLGEAIEGDDFELSHLQLIRQSKFGHNDNLQLKALPRIKCVWDQLE